MKRMKSTIMAFALCALCAGANAQTVTASDVEALPGETVAFVLNLTGGKADTYTAMQFDVQFPATGFTTTGKYSVSELWPNATAIVGTVDAEGTATIPVASSEAIGEADVEGLLAVSFTVGSDVAFGEYDVTLTNLWLGYGTSSKDYLDDVTFKVKVVERHTVVLDEDATTAPSEAAGVNVRVVRTIGAGNWSTICLPFAMTSAQTKEAFGDDVQIADFTGCEATYDDAEENIVALKVNFEDVAEMEANHPYIIKVGSDMTEFSVNGVDIAPTDELSVDRDEDRYKRNGKWYYDYNSFVGTYEAGTEIPESSLFLSGNKFWYSTGKTTTKAFRGYFAFYMVLSDITAAEARISLWIDGGMTTGVNEELRMKNEEGLARRSEGESQFATAVIYDLQGRRMESSTSNSQRSILKKGLYVKDGKKIIIK